MQCSATSTLPSGAVSPTKAAATVSYSLPRAGLEAARPLPLVFILQAALLGHGEGKGSFLGSCISCFEAVKTWPGAALSSMPWALRLSL